MDKKGLTENTMETGMKRETEVAVVSGTDERTKIQAAAGKENAAVEQAAPKKEATAEIFLQYREYEVTMEMVTERVKSHYYAKGYAKDSIEDMQIYVKPEDFTAYYVINDGVVGKVSLF